MITHKRKLAALLLAAAVGLTACGSSDTADPNSPADPSATSYEIVPGATFHRDTGKTTFNQLPIINTVTIALPQDPSMSRTYSRMANPMTAQLLDALAMALTAPAEQLPSDGPSCGAIGDSQTKVDLPKFTVTVLDHGQLLDPEIPTYDCSVAKGQVQDVLERILALDDYEQTVVN